MLLFLNSGIAIPNLYRWIEKQVICVTLSCFAFWFELLAQLYYLQDDKSEVCFLLHCQKFIELVRVCSLFLIYYWHIRSMVVRLFLLMLWGIFLTYIDRGIRRSCEIWKSGVSQVHWFKCIPWHCRGIDTSATLNLCDGLVFGIYGFQSQRLVSLVSLFFLGLLYSTCLRMSRRIKCGVFPRSISKGSSGRRCECSDFIYKSKTQRSVVFSSWDTSPTVNGLLSGTAVIEWWSGRIIVA